MATVGSKIILNIQVNAQNDTTDKPFPLVYDKIIYIAINVFKIRKRCILREIWIFFYYISTKIIHVVNSPPCTEQTLHNHFFGLKQIVLDISFNMQPAFYDQIAHFLWSGGDSIFLTPCIIRLSGPTSTKCSLKVFFVIKFYLT